MTKLVQKSDSHCERRILYNDRLSFFSLFFVSFFRSSRYFIVGEELIFNSSQSVSRSTNPIHPIELPFLSSIELGDRVYASIIIICFEKDRYHVSMYQFIRSSMNCEQIQFHLKFMEICRISFN